MARDAHPRDLEPLLRVIDNRIPVNAYLGLGRLYPPRLPLGEGIHSADAGEKRQQGENFSPRHGTLKNKGGRSKLIYLPNSTQNYRASYCCMYEALMWPQLSFRPRSAKDPSALAAG